MTSSPFHKCGHVFLAYGEAGWRPFPPPWRGRVRERGNHARTSETPESHQTRAEWRLWETLRARRFAGYKFKRQQPLGSDIVDFVCIERRLVGEVDGSQRVASPTDRKRDHWLAGEGFRVARFWDNVVLQELESVEEAILAALEDDDARSP